ncbi:hypothetical protein T484DRAFT_1827012 [Baffinella frigidus]|nr:hypothetical protein T484DRAFT_1827012 [Cryptophyta sp. CCMP2293]
MAQCVEHSHFHPTVKHFVASLLTRTKIAYPGDPLEDFQASLLTRTKIAYPGDPLEDFQIAYPGDPLEDFQGKGAR